MKNLLLLIITCALSSSLFGQGNLQFNQVKLVSTLETVPTGKAWKVENATYGGGLVFCVAGTTGSSYCGSNLNNISAMALIGVMSFTVNGQPNYISILSSGAGFSPNLYPFPIWLPAGTTLSVGTNMLYLSIIEFNIIP
jgi:hypothetical protein